MRETTIGSVPKDKFVCSRPPGSELEGFFGQQCQFSFSSLQSFNDFVALEAMKPHYVNSTSSLIHNLPPGLEAVINSVYDSREPAQTLHGSPAIHS